MRGRGYHKQIQHEQESLHESAGVSGVGGTVDSRDIVLHLVALPLLVKVNLWFLLCATCMVSASDLAIPSLRSMLHVEHFI